MDESEKEREREREVVHFFSCYISFVCFIILNAYETSVKVLLLWTMVLHMNEQNSKHEIGFICNNEKYLHIDISEWQTSYELCRSLCSAQCFLFRGDWKCKFFLFSFSRSLSLRVPFLHIHFQNDELSETFSSRMPPSWRTSSPFSEKRTSKQLVSVSEVHIFARQTYSMMW